MEPLVSVIVPVYNVLPYLREALDSVINQTYRNLEILIVDDGSTDGSGEICDEYLSDSRVIVIHQENKGLSGARNTALDQMTGEYVAFLDSDDAFMPVMIEKMVEAILRNSADVAMCGYVECFTESHMCSSGVNIINHNPFAKETVFLSSEMINMMLSGKASWTVWNKISHKSLWRNLRFPEGENFEDMRIGCPLFERSNRIVAIPKTYIQYRRRPESITSVFTMKNLQDLFMAFRYVEEYVDSHVPDTFSPNSMICLREQFAKSLSLRYGEMLRNRTSPEVKSLARKEATYRWKSLGNNLTNNQIKIIRFLFLYAPQFISPFRACLQSIKHLSHKSIHSYNC